MMESYILCNYSSINAFNVLVMYFNVVHYIYNYIIIIVSLIFFNPYGPLSENNQTNYCYRYGYYYSKQS